GAAAGAACRAVRPLARAAVVREAGARPACHRVAVAVGLGLPAHGGSHLRAAGSVGPAAPPLPGAPGHSIGTCTREWGAGARPRLILAPSVAATWQRGMLRVAG